MSVSDLRTRQRAAETYTEYAIVLAKGLYVLFRIWTRNDGDIYLIR